MREESSSAGRPSEAKEAGTEDPVRVAVDAAELGTWHWHIPSGRLQWTPRTYEMFGHQPGSIVTSYDLFLRQVHPPDRPAVVDWISHAIREGGRTAFEFRIDRPDGSVRRVRSTGRALPDELGHVVWMVGVVEDVTERQQQSAPPSPAVRPPQAPPASFSARQVAHVLGVAQVTVKRLALSGEIRSLRSSRKNSQRFAPRDVIDYLRRASREALPFDAAVDASDVSACMVQLLEELLGGKSLEALLDERVRPAAHAAPAPFVSELLSRLPFLAPEQTRSAFPVLLVEVGIPGNRGSEVVACLLRAYGHEVLRPAAAADVTDLTELAERVRSRLVIVAIGEGPRQLQERGFAVAAAIASARSATTTVCLYGGDDPRPPRGVVRFRSMCELASILRRT